MKKKIFKRGMAGLLAVLTAFTTLIGMGTTAFAASETAESYMVSYPRDGDAVQVYDHSTWGHDAKTYMNGWSTGASDMTTIHCMDSYDGKRYENNLLNRWNNGSWKDCRLQRIEVSSG